MANYILEFLYRLPAIVIALSFHEWAHAYAAYRLGDPTARNLGRMTVNPLAHIDPFGALMMVIARFGWAKPVPINPRNFSKPRRDEIIVSLAGVTVNLIIAFITLAVMYTTVYFTPSLAASNTFMKLMENLYFINIGLFVFNLMPVPPLDGYRVLQSLLAGKVSYNVLAVLERYSFMFLIGFVYLNSRTGLISRIVFFIVSQMDNLFYNIFGLFT